MKEIGQGNNIIVDNNSTSKHRTYQGDHYIPRFLLKAFSADQSSFFTWNKQFNNLAPNEHFYNVRKAHISSSFVYEDVHPNGHEFILSFDGAPLRHLDDIYKKIEARAAPIVKEIINCDYKNFLIEDYNKTLIAFLLIQRVRTEFSLKTFLRRDRGDISFCVKKYNPEIDITAAIFSEVNKRRLLDIYNSFKFWKKFSVEVIYSEASEFIIGSHNVFFHNHHESLGMIISPNHYIKIGPPLIKNKISDAPQDFVNSINLELILDPEITRIASAHKMPLINELKNIYI